MNTTDVIAPERDHSPETLAAELTDAVFPVALSFGVADSWLDLELDLWHALAETVERFGRPSPGGPWKGLLAALTYAAYQITLRHGGDSITGAREGLYEAFRSAIRDKVRGLRQATA
jgi:hypothetical protein